MEFLKQVMFFLIAALLLAMVIGIIIIVSGVGMILGAIALGIFIIWLVAVMIQHAWTTRNR